jgi:hypothetical protein
MKILSSMVFAGAVALAVVPAFAAWNISLSGANSGVNQITSYGHGFIHTGTANSVSVVANVGSFVGGTTVNGSLSVSNTGVNQITNHGSGAIITGNANSASGVVNFHSFL